MKFDTSSQSDHMVLASNSYSSSLPSAESIPVSASALGVIDGRDQGAFEVGGSVILMIAFSALVTLMCRKRKHARRRCYY
jgi:hypothetical protein